MSPVPMTRISNGRDIYCAVLGDWSRLAAQLSICGRMTYQFNCAKDWAKSGFEAQSGWEIPTVPPSAKKHPHLGSPGRGNQGATRFGIYTALHRRSYPSITGLPCEVYILHRAAKAAGRSFPGHEAHPEGHCAAVPRRRRSCPMISWLTGRQAEPGP